MNNTSSTVKGTCLEIRITFYTVSSYLCIVVSCRYIKIYFFQDVYTILNRIQLTTWTICAFRVMNPHQWSFAKQSGLKWKCWPNSAETSWSQKGWSNYPTKLQFKSILTQKSLMLSKRYESTEVDHRTWLHVDWSYYECYYAFYLVCCGCDTSYIASVHIQCQASIYTLSLCRGHSWRMPLAKQETLTPPGHLVSPLVLPGSVNVHRGTLLLVPQWQCISSFVF